MKDRFCHARLAWLWLLLISLTLACIRVELARPATVTPAPTSIVWPTLSPRATPLTISLTEPEPSCAVPDLVARQYLSASGSFTQTERSASTPMLCHLKRDSCGYQKLVGILDPTIVFYREEAPPYDAEDHVIHPAMVLPLARLNQLVQAEWGGVYQLRVTDAYDSLLDHDPPESKPETRYSLHYEGRAIDLTTWPVDLSRYGRLCALAHCAGFDWVHHEGNHCHASIRADSLCGGCGE